LDDVFPEGEYAHPNWRSFLETSGLPLLEPGEELPVRVITVPKTLKTPRIIAIEPTAMQFMQQGILELIEQEIARDRLLTSFISWKHQEPNQLLAHLGSLNGLLATLDLSEASDRVSNQLVRKMTSGYGIIYDAIDACRSRKADVPGHGVIRLAKFASMGSALTFPLESIVFITILFCGIERALNTRLTKKLLMSFLGQVRVYGDDIIVPVEFVPYVYSELETFGFRVNAGKSFWTGRFRESCGKEYYGGYDVSIVRCRSGLPTTRRDASEIVSTVSLRNRLFKAGYVKAVEYLDDEIKKLIPFPQVLETSPVLGRWNGEYDVHRYHKGLQIPLVRGLVTVSKIPDSRLEGWAALHKFFLKRGDLPVFDRKHLERSGRPVSVDIKTRWAPPF